MPQRRRRVFLVDTTKGTFRVTGKLVGDAVNKVLKLHRDAVILATREVTYGGQLLRTGKRS
jgi:hypothetical protein